ncbi:MAG: hypothetical protein V3V61_01040 [Gammaproteobacteria bacterium]
MSDDRLLTEFARAAHNLNTTYSLINDLYTKTVRRWDNLRYQDRKKKLDTFKKMADLHRHTRLTAVSTHELWRKSAPDNHPCNVEFDLLNDAAKKKDELYIEMLELFNELRGDE